MITRRGLMRALAGLGVVVGTRGVRVQEGEAAAKPQPLRTVTLSGLALGSHIVTINDEEVPFLVEVLPITPRATYGRAVIKFQTAAYLLGGLWEVDHWTTATNRTDGAIPMLLDYVVPPSLYGTVSMYRNPVDWPGTILKGKDGAALKLRIETNVGVPIPSVVVELVEYQTPPITSKLDLERYTAIPSQRPPIKRVLYTWTTDAGAAQGEMNGSYNYIVDPVVIPENARVIGLNNRTPGAAGPGNPLGVSLSSVDGLEIVPSS